MLFTRTAALTSRRGASLFRPQHQALHSSAFFRANVRISTGPVDVTAGLVLGATFGSFYLMDSQAGIYPYVIMPLMRLLDPEDVHRLSIQLASYGLSPKDPRRDREDSALEMELWGHTLTNPLGLAAGFDKHAEAVDAMFDLGFGLVEVGSITPRPQPGNPRPRVFRIPEARAVINRYGFNSEGHAAAYDRLMHRYWGHVISNQSLDPETSGTEEPIEKSYRSGRSGRLLGINLGKNTDSPTDSYEDYVEGVKRFGHLADYLVVNVSCPNTPGQREQQKEGRLVSLLKQVVSTRNQLNGHQPPLVVKISPDLSEAELREIADAALTARVDGIIISNTTTQRPRQLLPLSESSAQNFQEKGGLSGLPVRDLALRTVRQMYQLTDGRIPLIGCGGVSSGADAVALARAGASAVQLYTSMVYDGPGLPRRIKDEVVELLGDQSWKDIVGKDA
ncbi:Dihydroorotate dehydrogenase-domain-containing protein [Dimargaris cristalligena]|uniref:Dihydroorotate dehydrogenase (quinone), mitochondrial n=1 Tax=Dimargaris cristalligena TaxID=215637 RepID=A0A4P9ZYL5_9FUNG|nr:Dihydroorotate dehydrogenase-domain-containing protein [Dimargaris cristalligena]|eukprot:RKP38161.1 Dihydroorotate dehydrogenase-domain-containing protein [Dimargaris cristalligena]